MEVQGIIKAHAYWVAISTRGLVARSRLAIVSRGVEEPFV